MDKLGRQIVCKIVGEATLVDIDRIREALVAVYGDNAENIKLWEVFEAGLERKEILEKPAKVETPVPSPSVKPRTVTEEIAQCVIDMWPNGESFMLRDIHSLVGAGVTGNTWASARQVLNKMGYKTVLNGNCSWTIKREGK